MLADKIVRLLEQAKSARHIGSHKQLQHICFCIEIWVHMVHILAKLDFAYLESCDPICQPCQLC